MMRDDQEYEYWMEWMGGVQEGVPSYASVSASAGGLLSRLLSRCRIPFAVACLGTAIGLTAPAVVYDDVVWDPRAAVSVAETVSVADALVPEERVRTSDALDLVLARLRKYDVEDGRVLLLPGSPVETYGRSIDGSKGRSLMIFGGIHGDERGAYLAADRLYESLEVSVGSVTVFPRLNRRAVEADRRHTGQDLNRAWTYGSVDDLGYEGSTGYSSCSLESELIMAVKQYVHAHPCDVLINAHEGSQRYAQTFVVDNEGASRFLDDVVRGVNADLAAGEGFKVRVDAMPGTATYAASNEFGCIAFGLETAKAFPDELSAQMQLRAYAAVMDAMGIEHNLDASWWPDLCGPLTARGDVYGSR
ncbi:MAG: succinylglutamate desuccinylase/aspartoacylase family protein [Nanoarchaeota archaeon]